MAVHGRAPLAWRLILWLLPGHLRREHERELAQFLALEAPHDRADRLRFTFSLLADVLRAAPGAHLDVLRQDLVVARRQLTRAPSFAVLAILTLAVGIGGNVALFSVVDNVLLRPLPYAGAERLVRLDEENTARGLARFGVSPANFHDLTAQSEDWLQAATVYQQRSGTVRLGETPERVIYTVVSGGFFDVFLERPQLGRTLRPEDDVPGSTAVVVSHDFWRRMLGADPEVVGRNLPLDGEMHHVVGVMPPHFDFPAREVEMWKPLAQPAAEWERRGARFLGAVLRLRTGASPDQVAQQVASRAADLAERYPETNEGWSAHLQDLRSATVGGVRTPLLVVWYAAGLILLIAVANVANLMLGRGVARRSEMAMRRALGARGGRLARQTLTEGSVLALLGGLLGLGLAALLLMQVRSLGADVIPRVESIGLDGRALVFTFLLVGLSTLLFSALPVWSSRDGAAAFEGVRGGTSRRRARWQGGLVVAEIALAMVVLIASSLLVRSMIQLLDQPLGYQPENVVTFRVEPPFRLDLEQPLEQLLVELARERQRIAAAYEGLLARLGGGREVIAAGAVNRLPLTGNWWITGFALPTEVEAGADHDAYIRVVTPGYLEAMGTRLLRGRPLSALDRAGAELSVVIDETFARRHWGEDDALGQRILLEGPPDQPRVPARIVGVAEAIHQNSLAADLRPTFYVTLAQALEGHGSNWGMDIVLRTTDGTVDAAALRRAVGAFLPDAAVFRLQPMTSLLSASIADRRLQLLLLGAFALLALLLTLVGVYGVLALAVRQRRRELGVRMALGASPGTVRWLVQRHALRWVALGTALGLSAALLAARLFASQVYGISVFDGPAFLAGPLGLALVALAGAAVPALRATRLDPAIVLREE